MAIDTTLSLKRPMREGDQVLWDSRGEFKSVDVLRKYPLKEIFAVEEGDEMVRESGGEFSGPELGGEGIERERVLAEEGDIEDVFRVGEVEPGERGVEAGGG